MTGRDRRRTDCTIRFEGDEVPAISGEPVAVALHAASARVLSRSIKYHRPRSFFCLSGHCGACLMRIDGVPNVKACRATCADGLEVERQNAFPSGSFDVLAAADLFFPRGMDHHTLMTSSRALNSLMKKVVREIGGLGRLPDEAPRVAGDRKTSPATADGGAVASGEGLEVVDVVVVGGGPAGLAAAAEAARIGARGERRRVLLVDEAPRLGGSLLSDPTSGAAHGPAAADALVDEARAAGVSCRPSAAAIGWYPEDEGGVLAVDDAGTLVRVRARRHVYATGSYDVNALFENNDRPGICSARAVGTLLVQHGVVPGKKVIVLGDSAYARDLVVALTEAGAAATLVDGVTERAIAASGSAWVTGLRVDGAAGPRRIACDLIAVASCPAPATELLRQHGAEVLFSPAAGGFACVVDGEGRTREPTVYACGDACGFVGTAGAELAGRKIGRAVRASLDQEGA